MDMRTAILIVEGHTLDEGWNPLPKLDAVAQKLADRYYTITADMLSRAVVKASNSEVVTNPRAKKILDKVKMVGEIAVKAATMAILAGIVTMMTSITSDAEAKGFYDRVERLLDGPANGVEMRLEQSFPIYRG